jgi:hypothetical protein
LKTPSCEDSFLRRCGLRRFRVRAAHFASACGFPSSGFLTLSTVCSLPDLAGLVLLRAGLAPALRSHASSTLGVSRPPELFPRNRSRCASRRPCPSCRSPAAPLSPPRSSSVVMPPVANRSHPEKFRGHVFGASCSTTGVDTAARVACVTAPPRRSKLRRENSVSRLAPLGFGPPQGFSPLGSGPTVSSQPPPMSFVALACRESRRTLT